ncbi:response regulator transcription factor [Streptomyces sp. NPDC001704]|nr:DNA-binding response regulator [Streptomyces sp. SDr-06]
MTVLLVATDEEASVLRELIHRNAHFRVVSHTPSPRHALAQARVLLPDLTVLDPSMNGDGDPVALFTGLRALTPPSGVILRTTPATAGLPELDAVLEEGAVHVAARDDDEALMAALITIGRRRESCDPDQ